MIKNVSLLSWPLINLAYIAALDLPTQSSKRGGSEDIEAREGVIKRSAVRHHLLRLVLPPFGALYVQQGVTLEYCLNFGMSV